MKKIKRILALLLVIFLIAMVFVTLYCAVTGSPYFMASLFVMLGLPLSVSYTHLTLPTNSRV